MTFSQLTQDTDVAQLACVYYHHPFNTALFDGSLTKSIFHTYLEQDTLYLHDFSQALLNVSRRLTNQRHIAQFEKFRTETLALEFDLRKEHFSKKTCSPFRTKPKKYPATTDYTAYLLEKTKEGSIGEAIACLLPCFWLYYELGKSMSSALYGNSSNPYDAWIKTYSSSEFADSTKAIVQIFDEITGDISQHDPHEKIKIKAAFVKSISCEVSFLQNVCGKPILPPSAVLPWEDFSGLEELDKQLSSYQTRFGITKPIHSPHARINSLGNTLASWIGVKVNQERVNEGRAIIATAREALAANYSNKNNIIKNALEKLQDLHARIIQKTGRGETTKHIVATLNQYGYFFVKQSRSFHLFHHPDTCSWTRRSIVLTGGLTEAVNFTKSGNATHNPAQAITR